jgi:hypothetical protein
MARGPRPLAGVKNDIELAAETLGRRGFSCKILYGEGATCASIREQLSRLARTVTAEDAVVIYYSGHGGRVYNIHRSRDPLDPAKVPEHYQFLVPEDFDLDADAFTGLLDIELSLAVARIATRNLTVILDCCYSGGLVRAYGDAIRKGLDRKKVEPRIARLNARIRDHLVGLEDEIARDAALLASDAAAHVVRIEAARSQQPALEKSLGGRPHGVLTAVWADTVRRHEAEPVTWAALKPEIVHRVAALTAKAQTAHVEGPTARLLFSLEAAPAPGGLGVVRGADGAWQLAGGTLYGISMGARFTVVPPTVQAPTPAQALAEVEVVEVSPDRARLAILSTNAAHPGASALHAAPSPTPEGQPNLRALRAFPARSPDAWDGGAPTDQEDRLRRAALLRAQTSGRDAHALMLEIELCVHVVDDGAPDLAGPDGERVARCVHERGVTTYPPAPLTAPAGAALRCELRRPPSSDPKHRTDVYVTIFDIDVDGRVTRRSKAESSGIAIGGGGSHVIDGRAHVGARPLALTWPPDMPHEGPGLRSLIVVAADQPHTLDDFECLDLRGYSDTLAPSLLDGLRVELPPMTRGEAASALRPLRYAILRVDIAVV